jgi:uncharacterized protein (DUF1015 family)
VAEIRPFKGIRYNQKIIRDVGSVICPPHDVIPPQLQDELYHRSEYNFIRIEFGRDVPDTSENNRYTRAAVTLTQWLNDKVLENEEKAAIYIHDYYFGYQGKNYKRRGIIVRVKLEEWSKRIIFPHEGTLSKSKTDRLSILWACRSNTSPILAMYQDNQNQIGNQIKLETKKKPIIETVMLSGEKHVVWAITDPDIIEKICGYLAPQPIYIADGHHRYESALMYKHERESYVPAGSVQDFNFVMMTLVEFNDPGLLILPPHRLVQGILKSELKNLKGKLATFFDLREFSVSDLSVWNQIDKILVGGIDHTHLGIYGLDGNKLLIMELKDSALIGDLMPAFHTDIYKKLDVSILDHVILEKLLNLGSQGEPVSLSYTYNKQDAVARVNDGEFQLAILLNPVKADVIKAIADAGDRMPRKSTYFFPKEPAGLVFNKFE